ncbi:hypothetical protein [Paramicrobacterium chengjingii]|nr:hypothetical protein [Microbacterium chengjingii]
MAVAARLAEAAGEAGVADPDEQLTLLLDGVVPHGDARPRRSRHH